MLKPIQKVASYDALAACQKLMQSFAKWLCDPNTKLAQLTQKNLVPPVTSTKIEGDWLWNFLQREEAKQPLLNRAKVLVAMPDAQKAALAAWVQSVSSLASQFQPVSAPWPVTCPLADKSHWAAFKTLMEAFYDKGFLAGLPYLANGTPTAAGGVTYAQFVNEFRSVHRLNPNPEAREVCVLCGGPLGDTPHVDHWIIKSAFPLLSICENNLTLICSTCNEAPNKGDKPVHSAGSFVDWFHPYLRPGNGVVKLDYVLPELAVKCTAGAPVDHPKAANLDTLLNLSKRWTREFKAEYAKHQDVLIRKERRRIQNAQARHTQVEILTYVQQWQEDLVASEPHHDVHQVLAVALQEPSRLVAWHSELSSVP